MTQTPNISKTWLLRRIFSFKEADSVPLGGGVLANVWNLPPDKAIESFEAKGYAVSWDWRDTWKEAHAKAFTVAKGMKIDILSDIRGAVGKALKEGQSFGQFKKELAPVLKAKGWWGKVPVDMVPHDPETPPPDEASGEVWLGSPWRLQTIFRTNLQSSMMAGRYAQMKAQTKNRPYWKYIAIMDASTRPDHARMNGKIFLASDPIWQTWYPPNGFNCFPDGTPVATPSGWKPIESIRRGDLVLGGSGNVLPVDATHLNSFDGELVRFVAEGLAVSATPNHRILSLRGWVRAENLVCGDILVQIPEVPSINEFIRNVNDLDPMTGDLSVSRPVERESGNAGTFNRNANFRKENVDPERGKVEVRNDLEAQRFEVFGKNEFGPCLRRLAVRVAVWMYCVKRFFLGGNDEALAHSSTGSGDFQLFGGQLSRFANLLGLAKAGMLSFLGQSVRGFSHEFAGGGFSGVVVDPLGRDCFAPASDGYLEMGEEFHKGMVSHPPSFAKLPETQKLADVEGAEGFADGAPLQAFDSLNNFVAYSRLHCVLRKIERIERIPYIGNVYNLSVREDQSYCIISAVVHNCRCRVKSMSGRELVRDGMIGSVEATDGTLTDSRGNTMLPDDGFDFNPGEESGKRLAELADKKLKSLETEIGKKVLVDGGKKISEELFTVSINTSNEDGEEQKTEIDKEKEAVSELNDIREKAKEGNLFLRWSMGPEYDGKQERSADKSSGEIHSGLSAIRIDPGWDEPTLAERVKEYGFLRMNNRRIKPYLYQGVQVGKDSDDHPSIRIDRSIGVLSSNLVEQLDIGLAEKLKLESDLRDLEERIPRADIFGKEILEEKAKLIRAKLKKPKSQ